MYVRTGTKNAEAMMAACEVFDNAGAIVLAQLGFPIVDQMRIVITKLLGLLDFLIFLLRTREVDGTSETR